MAHAHFTEVTYKHQEQSVLPLHRVWWNWVSGESCFDWFWTRQMGDLRNIPFI